MIVGAPLDSAPREEQLDEPLRIINFRQLSRNRSLLIGSSIILALVVVAILAPLIAPYDPVKLAVGKRLSPPSWAFPFGTDEFGRDILSRVIYGTRLTLYVGIVAVGIGLVSGMTVGAVAAYAGGWVSGLLMR